MIDFIYFISLITLSFSIIIIMSIRGAYDMKKERRLTEQSKERGFEYGIYYELQNGIIAFCFVHKDLNQAEKCLRILRENSSYTRIKDWQGKDYSFTSETFEKAIGEKINRKNFKIVQRSLRYDDNINYPKLLLESIYTPSLKMEPPQKANNPFS